MDKRVAESYAALKAQLYARGINTPENDLWIAATARANGLGVISFDKHFEQMGLRPLSRPVRPKQLQRTRG